MRTAVAAIVGFLLTACATTAPPAPATGQPFTGEVWGWDQQTGIVTLRQGPNLVHVKTTPDQVAALRLHQVATVRGEYIPGESNGSSSLRDSSSPAVRPSARRPRAPSPASNHRAPSPSTRCAARSRCGLRHPARSPSRPASRCACASSFSRWNCCRRRPGPPRPGRAPNPRPRRAPSRANTPSCAAGSRPSIPAGGLTVDSTRGPITVFLPAGATLRAGDWVDVQTSVHPAR